MTIVMSSRNQTSENPPPGASARANGKQPRWTVCAWCCATPWVGSFDESGWSWRRRMTPRTDLPVSLLRRRRSCRLGCRSRGWCGSCRWSWASSWSNSQSWCRTRWRCYDWNPGWRRRRCRRGRRGNDRYWRRRRGRDRSGSRSPDWRRARRDGRHRCRCRCKGWSSSRRWGR